MRWGCIAVDPSALRMATSFSKSILSEECNLLIATNGSSSYIISVCDSINRTEDGCSYQLLRRLPEIMMRRMNSYRIYFAISAFLLPLHFIICLKGNKGQNGIIIQLMMFFPCEHRSKHPPLYAIKVLYFFITPVLECLDGHS